MHTILFCNPSLQSQHLGSQDRGQPWLNSEFEASLACLAEGKWREQLIQAHMALFRWGEYTQITFSKCAMKPAGHTWHLSKCLAIVFGSGLSGSKEIIGCQSERG